MIGTEEEEEVRLEGEIILGDKKYEVDAEEERAQDFNSWVDALIKKYGEGAWIRIHVNVEEPDYKSWTFSASEENYQKILEKLEEKPEVSEV